MNIYRFIPNKTSALLFSLICVLTLAACAGGEPKSSMELDLRIIPDTTNATLIWNNPDAEIANISISYKNSTAANFEEPIIITDNPTIARNTTDVRGMIPEGSLTTNETYTFRVALKFGGADVNKSIITEEITRLIGPNLDQDGYADDDPRELDEDGDGTNDDIDAFPRNTTLSAFMVTELSARPGNSSVTLSWNNPAANIASISISYQRDDFVGQLMMNSSAQITPGEQNVQEIIDGLTNGQSYTFNVTLTLTGDDAAKKVVVASTTATPGTFSVTDLTAVPNDRSVTLSWNNPDADIASISIRYGITDSGMSTTVAASNTGRDAIVKQTIGGLMNGESYTFTVSLTLRDGAGKRVEAASDTATPNVFSVTNLTAIPNDRSVTLRWNNPAADIASISISYQRDGSGMSTTVGASNTVRRASVEETIDGLDNGVSYTFTVSLTLQNDDAGREGPAASIRWAIGLDDDGNGIADFLDADDDGDGMTNFLDVDDDGNGLIEIHNAEELDQVRADLTGVSFAGNNTGCGGQPGISECNGYELTQNISLNGYNGDNWEPIGICGNNTCSVGSELFNTVFDGNGYTISDLTITNPGGPYYNAAGLFAAIHTPAELRNINIASARITVNGTNVGVLVGYTNGGNITNNHVLDSTVNGTSNIGGLVGNGANAPITSSSADIVSVSGVEDSVGGLVGSGGGAIIISSNATVRTVSGRNNIGGLIGWGNNAVITSSYSESESVSGNALIGGLVGLGYQTRITSSYATGVVIDGFQDVGGLVGQGNNANIALSSADTMSTTGDFHVGALIGRGHMATITSSYAVSEDVSTINNRAGGLIGWGNDANIISSYAAVRTMSGGGEIGGLVGRGLGTDITSSYAVVRTMSGAGLGGLVGFGNATTSVTASYWDTQPNGVTLTISNRNPDESNAGRTTTQLQSPTDFTGSIYATWENDMCGGDDDSIAWDLGNSTQYPALNCTPNGLTPQRP